MLTARGKHLECGNRRQVANVVQLKLKAGPHYDAWKRALVRSLGGTLQEDSTA